MKLELGMVFAIPLVENAFGFGQLIAFQKPIFYMVACDVQAPTATVAQEEIYSANPVLMGNFFDVLIQNGRWPVVKKLNPKNVPFPCSKIKIGDTFFVESWDKKQKREATAEECGVLPFRTNHSAIILEDALKAHFGLKPWESKWFDPLKADTVAMLSKMI